MLHIYLTSFRSDALSVKEQAKLEHALGRKLLSLGLSELYEITVPPSDLDSFLITNAQGKPSLKHHPEIHFNISHTDDLVVCAFSDVPVGIDTEKERKFVEAILRRTLSPAEKEFFEAVSDTPEHRTEWFFRFWTLKEAFVKMTGTGVTVPLTDLTFSFEENASSFRITTNHPGVSCLQYVLPSGHYLSVCIKGPEEPAVFHHVP